MTAGTSIGTSTTLWRPVVFHGRDVSTRGARRPCPAFARCCMNAGWITRAPERTPNWSAATPDGLIRFRGKSRGDGMAS
jgi:hypothetical protein